MSDGIVSICLAVVARLRIVRAATLYVNKNMKGTGKGGEEEEEESGEVLLTFNGLQDVMCQKIVLSITTAVTTSNPTKLFLYICDKHTTGCIP
jgi:hypothetical protein